MARLYGEIGLLLVSGLRNQVERLQFRGYDVKLWIGRGLISKPFEVTGDQAAIDWLEKNFRILENDLAKIETKLKGR